MLPILAGVDRAEVLQPDRINPKGHAGDVLAVAFAPDGKTLASSSRDGTTRLWALANGAERATLSGHSGPGPLAFLPDGRSLITGGADGSLRRWDPAAGHLQSLRMQAHLGRISALAVSPDGKTLASGGGDHELRLWDLAAQLAPRPFADIEAKVQSLAISSDGKVIASATTNGVVQLWESKSGRERCDPIQCSAREIRLAFSPDGKVLATLPVGSSSGTLKLWDTATRRELDLLAVVPNFGVALFCRPEGAETGKPRATPWGSDPNDNPPSPERAKQDS